MDVANVRSSIKVLLVEDRAEDAELLVREMRRSGLDVDSRRVENEIGYEAALQDFAPDLILSDYTLPGFDGPLALQIARRQRPDTPFIFVSGTIGEERALEALRQGAVDYVLKDNRARLVPAIERALKDVAERDARRWALRQLQESEERFRFAMHYSPVGTALVAPEGRWLSVNPALCEIVGYTESELLTGDVQAITHPDDRHLSGEQTLHPQRRPRCLDPVERLPGVATGWQAALFHLPDPGHHRPDSRPGGAACERGAVSLHFRGDPGMDLGDRFRRRVHLLQSRGGGDTRVQAPRSDR
jgi:CheY-like chemotaxis protein